MNEPSGGQERVLKAPLSKSLWAFAQLLRFFALYLCAILSATAAIPATERAVLDAFYTQTNGATWNNQSGWEGPPGTECSWYGITCDGTGAHVTEIRMGSSYFVVTNNLTGTLPSLSDLTNLQYFDVDTNGITGSIPALGSLTQLTYFNVSKNNLTGTLPTLDGLANLQTFEAGSNSLSGSIPPFSSNNYLTGYAVYNNKLTGSIPSLTSLSSLQSIDLSSNQLSGTIPDLSGLNNLIAFFVGSNNLTGTIPTSLTQLSNLFNVDLSNNQLSGSIPDLTQLTKLGYLKLSNNNLTGGVPNLPIPNQLQATICPNSLTHSLSTAWDTATGTTPWYKSCPLVGQTSTTTTLQSSANPSVSGQSFVLTATVSGKAPTGRVTFYKLTTYSYATSEILCDSVPLQGGGNTPTATCTLSNNVSDLAGFQGYAVAAIYFEDANNSASTSNTLTQSVKKADTSIAIATPVPSMTVGSPVIISVKFNLVSPGGGAPTGPIYISLGNSGGCTIALPTSSSCTLTPLDTGSNTLKATYAGDVNFNSSNTSVFVGTPQKANTSIILTSSTNPSSKSGTFFSAVILGSGEFSVYPETVTIYDGSSVLCSFSTLDTNLCQSGPLALGKHTITAAYAGDASNNPSISAPLIQTVYDSGASISVSFAPNPAQPGQPITATVNVATSDPAFAPPGAPTGVVTVLDGAAYCYTNLPNKTCTFTPAGSGVQTIVLNYSGDNYYSPVSYIANLVVSGSSQTTTTSLSSSANPSTSGNLFWLTATITGNAPTGAVTFLYGSESLCGAVPLSGTGNSRTAACPAAFPVGSYTFTAAYTGDANNAASSGTLVQVVNNSALAPTTTTLASSSNPSIANQAITLVATITGTSPTGTVNFTDGDTALCSSSVRSIGTSSKAFCVATLQAGVHSFAAGYAGDANNAGSTSTLSQTVSTAAAFNPDQFGLTGSWYNPVTSGQGILFEVYPDNVAPGTGTIGGGFFTYTANGINNRQWYTLQGNVKSNSSTAQVGIFAPIAAGNFNAGPKISAGQVGSATITFGDCTHMTVAYNFTDGSNRSGTIPLTRLDANVSCSATGDTGAGDGSNFLISGAWYNPATSGQGLFFDLNPNQTTLFAAWYTYAPLTAGTSTQQTWYTLQTNSLLKGTTTIQNVPIYATSGGVFNDPAPVTTTQVGTAVVSISCTAITVNYTFTAGDNAGQNNSIVMRPVGPVPANCHP